MPRGFLIAFNTIVAFALAEGAARLAEWVHPPNDTMRFAYSPYRMLKMIQAPFALNREGFRAGELETYRGAFLVEFLGGSVCVGIGDNVGETLPERLEDALHAAGLARTRVLNLCQGGATSAQELAILTEYGLLLHPQAVLSFDGANDIFHPRPIGEDDAPNLPYENVQLQALANGQDGWSHLAVLRVGARIVEHLREPSPSPGAPVPLPEILESYFYHLGLARTLVEAQGGFYAILLQPTLHLDKPWSADETAMWRTRRPKDADSLTRVARERYLETREAANKWSESTGTELYDLTDAFAATRESIYSDSVHFRGSRGYERLESELEQKGLIDRLQARYRAWEASL